MKILVISGGNTSERPVSLRSSKAVINALKELGHQVRFFDLRSGYKKLKEALEGVDLVFPKLHGKEAEDGELYQFLKDYKIPYVGSDPRGAKLAFDKVLTKKYLEKNNIPTGKWKIVQSLEDIRDFGLPCVLKASEGGSSREVALIHSEKDLGNSLVKSIFKLKGQMYVEELLQGIEITVGILKDKPLPVIEIRPPEGKWFDYKNKYSGETQEIVGAPSVSEKIQKKAQEISLKIHQDLKIGPYSRTDFIVVDDIPYVLEINTPCGVGFTSESLFPKMAQAVGLDFKALIQKLIDISI